MLTLRAGQVETLWDEALPIEVRELPDDLAQLDLLLGGEELLEPIVAHWQREVAETGRAVLTEGRPTIAVETYVRLMVLKTRYRWGYRTLMAEVSDSIHLRRFCRIALSQRVPCESTVRKLTRRIGADTVNELMRVLISRAVREKRFRVRAVRVDSTVIEADVKYPTDAGLASSGVRALAREGRKLARLVGEKTRRARDRSRSMGRALRAITRTIRRRTGEAKSEVLKLTARTGELLDQSIREARRLAAVARQGPRRAGEAEGRKPARGARGSLREGLPADQAAGRGRADPGPPCVTQRSGRPADQEGQARKAQRVRVRRADRRDHREHQAGSAGADPPGRHSARQPGREHALPQTVAELQKLGLDPREIALDGRFHTNLTTETLSPLTPERVFISGRQQPGSRRTQRRLQRFRTGAEGRISHLKRGYGLNRSRLKGHQGQQITSGWAILAYNRHPWHPSRLRH